MIVYRHNPAKKTGKTFVVTDDGTVGNPYMLQRGFVGSGGGFVKAKKPPRYFKSTDAARKAGLYWVAKV